MLYLQKKCALLVKKMKTVKGLKSKSLFQNPGKDTEGRGEMFQKMHSLCTVFATYALRRMTGKK